MGGSCEGGSFHTLGSPFTAETVGGWGKASETRRRAQPQGCRGQSREIPAQRIGADQHSPAQEASLLIHRGGLRMGAETPGFKGQIPGKGLVLAA